MKTQNQSEIVQNMDKRALRMFGGLSLIVYSIALAYCYKTDHLFEAGVVGTVMLGLAILIGSMSASAGARSKKQVTETSFKQAA